jgi:hypothetical protein
MLRRTGLVAGGAALATVAIAAPANADGGGGDDRRGSMTGGWNLHRQDVFGVYDGIFLLATGGVTTYQDINPPGPLPVLGVWSESGRRFRWEIWSGFDADPASDSPASTAQVVGQGTRSDRTFTSTYTTSYFEAATGALLGAVDGTATGTRFQV